jgi:hypothetical protein
MIGATRAGAILLGLCLVAVLAEDIVRRLTGDSFSRAQLIPWLLPLLVAFWVPVHHQVSARRLHVADPFVYVTLTYLGPAMGLGTVLFIATGITDIPDFLISDPAFSYPLALLYTALAVASFGLGVNFAPAGTAGHAIGLKMPAFRWSAEALLLPGLLFLLLGAVVQFLNFRTGVIGFQTAEPGRFNAAWFFLGLVFNFGQFLLWFAILRAARLDWRHIASALLMLILLSFFAVLAGSRGYLLSSWLIAVLACFTTGQRPTIRTIAFIIALGAVSLGVGTAFASAFRALKFETAITAAEQRAERPTPEQLTKMAMRRVTVGEQLDLARHAAGTIATGSFVSSSLRGVASRLNTLTQLTVLVSNRKTLADQLPSTLGSGIWIGLATALIPRPLWPEKPLIGDPHSYGTLFFQFATNSFAMTPFGDLLINFGPLGIPAGMFLLGVLMRMIYSALVEQLPGAAGRAAIYALLVSQLSMEGSFGTIVPWLLRVLFIASLATLVTAAIVAITSRRQVLQA